MSGVPECFALDRIEVTYTPTSVRVTPFVGAKPVAKGTACVLMGLGRSRTFELIAPVADRELTSASADANPA
jgi:hypothetical protein